MATLAPTISHTLAARSAHGSDGAMGAAHCDMPSMASMPMDSMDSMASMDAMPSMHGDASHDPSADKQTQHTQLADGDACGYCSLLAHMPVVPSVEALFAVAVLVRQHIVATRFESVLRVEPLSFAQPRAPPYPT